MDDFFIMPFWFPVAPAYRLSHVRICASYLVPRLHAICGDIVYARALGSEPPSRQLEFELISYGACPLLHVDVDRIFNLGCPASLIHYQRDAVQTIKMNGWAAINMLESARRVAKAIIATYGDRRAWWS